MVWGGKGWGGGGGKDGVGRKRTYLFIGNYNSYNVFFLYTRANPGRFPLFKRVAIV